MISRAPDQTRALGVRLGKLLRGGDVVFLVGDLGSGKTTFAQGVAAGLGYRGAVTSPTFVLERRYKGRRWNIHHLDLYRVKAGEAGDIGIEESLRDPEGVALVEWPEAASELYPGDRLEVRLAHGADADERTISLAAVGERAAGLKARLEMRERA